jgi:GntR family transcriptional regulator
MQKHGIQMVNYEINTLWVDPDEEVCRALELSQPEKVLKLERLRGTEKEPTVYFVSYFHPRVGLTGNEDFTRHLYEIIESDYHIVASVSKEEIRAILADHILAEKLTIEEGDPILYRKRKVCDPGERPIEFNLCYYRADKFTYTINIEKK